MRITLDFPDELHDALKRKAAAESITIQEFIIRSLNRYLQASRKRAHLIVPSKRS